MKNAGRIFKIVGLSTLLLCSIIYAATNITFTDAESNIMGKRYVTDKLTVTVTPSTNEPNIGGSSDACDVNVVAELLRIAYAISGSDDDYTINISDETDRTIFSKTDCSTSASYAIDEAGTSGTKHHGVAMAGPITVDVCDLGKTEIQTLTITSDANDPNGGTFEISLNDVNSSAIAYDCNADVLAAALEDMNNIDDVSVDGNNLYDGNSLAVTFIGEWYGDDVNMLVIDVNGLTMDAPGTNFTGNETETQKGAYDVTGITLTIYRRDERY